MPAKLKNGVIGAKGGKRENQTGRPPEWLKAKCQALIEKHKLIDFLVDVAKGKDVEHSVDENGESKLVPAAVRDRIKAMEILLERGYGKSPQQTDLTSGGKGLLEILREVHYDS
jgi:hypothetical protein